MHARSYITMCLLSLATLLTWGAPEMPHVVFASAVAIAILGVPHGGLDHWQGRRLLKRRFAQRWGLVFFSLYLGTACLVAFGWIVQPVVTVLLFFIASAWHFGREDQQANPKRQSAPWFEHLAAASVGGLVIWIPSLLRPDEFTSLLLMIIPGSEPDAAGAILRLTRALAGLLLPVALLLAARTAIGQPRCVHAWVPVATALTVLFAPILVSFSLFFCGWHSLQGLNRLRSEEGLTVPQFALHSGPLSALALTGVLAIGAWLLWPPMPGRFDSITPWLQMTFIGLSSIAVPHMILHGVSSWHIPLPDSEGASA